MSDTQTTQVPAHIQPLVDAGLHYGFNRSRRHASAKPFIFGSKGGLDIFDLEKSEEALKNACAFAQTLGNSGKKLLFVGGKHEARTVVRSSAESLGMPFVVNRWVGGTLTNFSVIRKRVERLIQLIQDRERGELDKYTKKERLLIDREIDDLEEKFGGLRTLESVPGGLFVIDPRYEHIAVSEARSLHIPVIALAGSDCNFKEVMCAIPGNDALVKSITHVTRAIADAYREGVKMYVPVPAPVLDTDRSDTRPTTRRPRTAAISRPRPASHKVS